MGRTIRIVNYAVNGSGVGHLTRLVAINRWIRRYAAHAGVAAEIWFLTSSEADGILFQEKFASFKLPSKSVVGETGIDKLAYFSLAKQWVWHSLGLLRPDLFIVDTFPRGAFGELLSALDLARARGFVYRPMKGDFASRADFQAMLPLYDAIVVPDAREAGGILFPASIADRVRWVGPVTARERAEMLPREEARARLGLGRDAIAVYVSAGGGGDAHAERQLTATIEAVLAADPRMHAVVGAGPLYRGRVQHGSRITWLTPGAAAEWMPGFDLAVVAAGYNTFFEVMHAGLPAIFLPQEKIADEQDVRARRAVEAGAARIAANEGELAAALGRFAKRGARAKAADAARALVPHNHARDAAAELLRLVLSAGEVDAARDAIDDEMLAAAARTTGGDVEPFLEAIRFLDPDDGRPGRGRRPRATGRLATALVGTAHAHGLPPALAGRVLTLLARKLPGTPAERARATDAILDAFAPFADWPGAIALLKVFGSERELTAEGFAQGLGRLLASLRKEDADLYQGIARLSRAQGEGAQPESNSDLLRRATARTGGGRR